MKIPDRHLRWFNPVIDIIGAAMVLFEGVFICLRNMSSMSEDTTTGALYTTIGLIFVVFKVIFRMRGHKQFWAIGAVITLFLGLSFVLTNTETSANTVNVNTIVQNTLKNKSEDTPDYVTRAKAQLKKVDESVSTHTDKLAAIPTEERTNAAAEKLVLDGETAKQVAALATYNKAITDWKNSLLEEALTSNQNEHSALAVFRRIPEFLAAGVKDPGRYIAFVFWLFTFVLIELIEYVVFDPENEISEKVKKHFSMSKDARNYRARAVKEDLSVRLPPEMALLLNITKDQAERLSKEAFAPGEIEIRDNALRVRA